jgi:uncharacterized protein
MVELMRKYVYILLLTCLSSVGFAQPPIPELWGHRIHDKANVLDASVMDRLEAALALDEDSTSNQIAVLVIPSLQGASLESYAISVAHDAWKLGSDKKGNGVLLLVVVEDRKIRIEVGEGLEGILTDAVCARIIRNEMAPFFREKKYNEGVEAGVMAIAKTIAGEYQAVDEVHEMPILLKFFIFFILLAILAGFSFGSMLIPGVYGWVIYPLIAPFLYVVPLVLFGQIVAIGVTALYLILYPIIRLSIKNKKFIHNTAFAQHATKSWSTHGSTINASRARSSRGFSGRGGTFRGGGSSGSW